MHVVELGCTHGSLCRMGVTHLCVFQSYALDSHVLIFLFPSALTILDKTGLVHSRKRCIMPCVRCFYFGGSRVVVRTLMMLGPSFTAQLQDVSRLKQESERLRVITSQLTSFVSSIAAVTERLAPK